MKFQSLSAITVQFLSSVISETNKFLPDFFDHVPMENGRHLTTCSGNRLRTMTSDQIVAFFLLFLNTRRHDHHSIEIIEKQFNKFIITELRKYFAILKQKILDVRGKRLITVTVISQDRRLRKGGTHPI